MTRVSDASVRASRDTLVRGGFGTLIIVIIYLTRISTEGEIDRHFERPHGKFPGIFGTAAGGLTHLGGPSDGSESAERPPRRPPLSARSRPRWCGCRCDRRILSPRASKLRYGWRR